MACGKWWIGLNVKFFFSPSSREIMIVIPWNDFAIEENDLSDEL